MCGRARRCSATSSSITGTDGQDVGFDPEFPDDPLDFPRIRAKNAINLLALPLGGLGQTPTHWQHSTYPDWARAASPC